MITLEVTGDEDACSPGHAHLESPNKHMEVWSLPMLEMMDSKRDFPSQAHAITKWYVYVARGRVSARTVA